jgi:hypothetical protein
MSGRSPMLERRQTANTLAHLECLIERMNDLGAKAEDAAARMAHALGGSLDPTLNTGQHELVSAIGDVIEIVTERSKLAHEAYRLIGEFRRIDTERWQASATTDGVAITDGG